jgi:hypothetical protein
MLPQAIFVSDWSISKKSFPLKPLGQMNRNLVGSIYGRSSINFYKVPSIDAAYQVSVHLAERFQKRRLFRNQPIRNKNCLWRPCFLKDRDEMNNLYRGLCQMNRNLVGSICGRSSIKIAHFVLIL